MARDFIQMRAATHNPHLYPYSTLSARLTYPSIFIGRLRLSHTYGRQGSVICHYTKLSPLPATGRLNNCPAIVSKNPAMSVFAPIATKIVRPNHRVPKSTVVRCYSNSGKTHRRMMLSSHTARYCALILADRIRSPVRWYS